MESLSFSLLPDEVINPGKPVEITTSRPTTISSARSTVTLSQNGTAVKAEISLKNESLIQLETAALKPGPYNITVRGLVDKETQSLVEELSSSFIVGAMKGQVDASLAVIHIVHLAVGDLKTQRLKPGADAPQGTTYLEIASVINRSTFSIQKRAFDVQGNAIDPDPILRGLEERRFQKYGKMTQRLHTKLQSVNDTEEIPVSIIPTIDFELPVPQIPNRDASEEPPEEKFFWDRLGSHHLQALDSLGVQYEALPRSLKVSFNATKSKISQVANAAAIGLVDYEDPKPVALLKDSMTISKSINAAASPFNAKGAGAKVAIWEMATKFDQYLTFEAKYENVGTPWDLPTDPGHPRFVTGIVKNSHPTQPNGYAPACQTYAANSLSYKANYWAVHDKQVNIVNRSFASGYSAAADSMDSDDLDMDFKASHFPSPLYTCAAGNTDSEPNVDPVTDEYVNNKGYNVLVVGNHDDTAYYNAPTTVWRNPKSPNMDRELPHISANGYQMNILEGGGTGTSFSAPCVAGAAAQILSIQPGLQRASVALRAILQAGAAAKMGGGTWRARMTAGEDQMDGAGPLDVFQSCIIANNQVTQRNNVVPSGGLPNAWAIDVANPQVHFPKDNKLEWSYRFSAPTPRFQRPKTRKYKVVLAWTGNVYQGWFAYTGEDLCMDLDVFVFNDKTGQLMGSRTSFDNNYEIVEFSAPEDILFRIDIRKKPLPNGVKDVATVFSVAWRSTRPEGV